MTTLLGRRRPHSEPGEMSWIALPGGARSHNVREVPRCLKVVVAHCQTPHPEGRVLFVSGSCFCRGSGTYGVVPFVALFG